MSKRKWLCKLMNIRDGKKGMLNAEHNFLKDWCKKVTKSKHEAMW
jgi:hypothetical protein